MAAAIDGILPKSLQEKIKESKVLVVGAGGIGCEVLKNLVMSGFPDIEIIDLDTIDLSNLNRQFLFHREHVGKSKAQVACESALKFNPDAKIKAYHDSVTSTDYGVNFFKKFDVVLSALDNRAARNHVNRMCVNGDVPLIESGTAGYDGQIEVIKRGLTLCYECLPKQVPKTFPGCTIRNTPSEPIHCIVWAKHLYNQLFGESIDDEDISPDLADKEALNDINAAETGDVARINTRQWAKEANYDAAKLFNKFFCDDISYLLSMSDLWKDRKAPTPIEWEKVVSNINSSGDTVDNFQRQHHRVWTLEECSKIFGNCIKLLSASFLTLDNNESLVWDKDDQPAMDFVAACANIRAYIFEIERKSRFEIKSMAGNIIPAIATTNAITAGASVIRAFNVLQKQLENYTSIYTRLRQNPRNEIIISETVLIPPNPSCYVCSIDPAIVVRVDTKRMRVKEFRDEVLKKTLNMINPELTNDAKGIIVISAEEEETECNEFKILNEMNIIDGVILKCDDFFQNYTLNIIIEHFDAERDQTFYEIVDHKKQMQTIEMEIIPTGVKRNGVLITDEVSDGPSTSKKRRISENATVMGDEDDDLFIIDPDTLEPEKSFDNISSKIGIKRKSDVHMEFIATISDDEEAEKSFDISSKIGIKRKSDVHMESIATISDDEDPITSEVKDDNDSNEMGPSKSKRIKH